MDKVIELIAAEMAEYSNGAYADHGSARDQLKRFCNLCRADLEADLAATRDLAEGYAQERNELKAENAKLKAARAALGENE